MRSISVHIISQRRDYVIICSACFPVVGSKALRAHSLTDRFLTLLCSKCAGTAAFASLGGLPSLSLFLLQISTAEFIGSIQRKVKANELCTDEF